MTKINIVLRRYDAPNPLFGVHYLVGDLIHTALVAEDYLNELFELGNEIEYSMEDIWNMIPVEWKNRNVVTEEWIRARVTAYDSIIRHEPTKK